MKITLDRRQFADTLKWVTSALDKKPDGAMGGVRIIAADEKLSLSAWDFVSAHSATLEASIGEDGEALVPGRMLATIVASLNTDDLTLSSTGGDLELSAGLSSYRIRTFDLKDYSAPPPPPTPTGHVHADDLAEVTGAVAWAADRGTLGMDSIQQVKLEAAGDLLTMAATDRFVVATDACSYDGDPFETGVPADAITAALAGINAEGMIGIAVDERMLSFIGERRSVSIRRYGTEFVAWRKAFDGTLPETLTTDARTFAGALKRVSALAEDKAPVRLEISRDHVSLTAQCEAGNGSEHVEAEASGEPLVTGFNPRYLASVLRVFDGPVSIAYSAATRKPFLITSPTMAHRKAIAMPMRVAS